MKGEGSSWKDEPSATFFRASLLRLSIANLAAFAAFAAG
jgi:hypothetical protein